MRIITSSLFFFTALLLTACQFATTPDTPVSTPATPTRPNILIILSDDQRYDTMDYMPRTVARIFNEGVTFPSAYVTTPWCCPSRASILTGMYAHNHGVRLNTIALEKETFVERLHKAGYYTGQVGKYLNSWDGSARPEFDFWVASRGGIAHYFNQRLNVHGTWSTHPGYLTHVLRDYALEFLRRATTQEKPFVLLFSPNSPHFEYPPGGGVQGANDQLQPPRPAPGDEKLYQDLAPHRPPSWNKVDSSGKPRWYQSLRPLTPDIIARIDTFRQKQLQSLNSFDQAIENLLDELARQGKLDNTLVIYLSDNGHFWGEHRIPWGKNSVYQESSRVPFAVRYPKLVAKPRVDTRLVANIDIAPTVYELAGIAIPADVDGRSLVPVLAKPPTTTSPTVKWRDELLLEGWAAPAAAKGGRAPYAAVHTGRYVYVETEGDRSELYDLMSDPHQMQNHVDNPAYARVVSDLKPRLQQLRGRGTGEKK